MDTMHPWLHARFPVSRILFLSFSVGALLGILLLSCSLDCGGEGDEDIPDLYFTEVQGTGTQDEWVELANTGNEPIDLSHYAITTESRGQGAPHDLFGNYDNLSEFGTPVLFDNFTFYLNAENLYEDIYYAPTDDPLDQFYILKVHDHNTWGMYYHIGEGIRLWWDEEEQEFINESVKNNLPLERLEDSIYQITLPEGVFHRYVYVSLDPTDTDKFQTDQTLSDRVPEAINGTVPLAFDLGDAEWNDDTRELFGYLFNEFNLTVRTSDLGNLYARPDLVSGTDLDIRADDNGEFLAMHNITVSPHFWTFSSLPHDGLIFVNDNQPDTMFYYDQRTGEQVPGPGPDVVQIDLTNEDHFRHHEGKPCFDEAVTVIGYEGFTIDLTDPILASQITTVHLHSPILAGTIYADRNTGDFVSELGDDVVQLPIPEEGWVNHLLFPRGITYNDYSSFGAPENTLNHLIIVDDSLSDPNGNRNELVANGGLSIWNNMTSSYEGDQMGWGTGGPAPEPAGGMSCQAYFDGDNYHWGNMWTLGEESKGEDNNVPAPAYGSADVVINEINPAYFELYNRGGSVATLSGWKLTGNGNQLTLSDSIAPGGFMGIPSEYWWIPFTPTTGGRVSLFDDLGVLTSSVGFQTDVPGNQYSWCARHIDGVGVDYRYNDSMGQPWANRVEGAQKNADWEHNVDRTPNRENYDDPTFLQIGTDSNGNYHILENISAYNPDWADGCYGIEEIGDFHIDNWDVIFFVGELDGSTASKLNEYLAFGGRLYVEQENWSALSGTGLYGTLGLEAVEFNGNVTKLTGIGPVAEEFHFSHSGSPASEFVTNDVCFPILENNGSIFSTLILPMDPTGPGIRYRAVISSVVFEHLSEETRGNTPRDYITEIAAFFLKADGQINHLPEIELIDPIPNPDLQQFATGPFLMWKNNDPDVWDQVKGSMRYTLYIHRVETLVQSMDYDARSPEMRNFTEQACVVPDMDLPAAGKYYWGILAEDRFGATHYSCGGEFRMDIWNPEIISFTPMIGNLFDDPLPIGDLRCFCSCPSNNGNEFQRPDRFAIRLRDNQGLVFSNFHNVAMKLWSPGYIPPSTAFWSDVLYSYEGDHEDDLPLFHLTRDREGTDSNIHLLTGVGDATFYMVPDGPIPDGKYVVHIIAADEVNRAGYLNFSFEIDFSGPDPPVGLIVSPETYRDPLDIIYLQEGVAHTISVTAQSRDQLASMSNVEFQWADANDEHAVWKTIGADPDTDDEVYSISWIPSSGIRYLRTIAYDTRSHYTVSEVFGSIVVDGTGPHNPLWVEATLDLDHPVRARVQGQVLDVLVNGQMSGIDHVIFWHYDSLTGSMERMREGEYDIIVPVIDSRFDRTVSMNSYLNSGNDATHAIFVQAVDRVGNVGEMSSMAVWTNTGQAVPIRVIAPATIRNVPMTLEVDEIHSSRDEVRSMTVELLWTEENYLNYVFSMRKGTLNNPSHLEELGLPPDCSYLWGYFEGELAPGLTNFEAMVTIEFHLSALSSLGTRTSDILDRIRLITREQDGDGKWRMVDLVGGQVQPVDEAKGLYRVQGQVDVLGDFVVIAANSDLTVQEIDIGQQELRAGEESLVSVTVHNGGAFPTDVDVVYVKLFTVDRERNRKFVDQMQYGTIESGFRYYPDDEALSYGNVKRSVWLNIPDSFGDAETLHITLRAEVDPDGYIRESDETNNALDVNITVICPPSPPALRILGPGYGLTVRDLIYFYGEVDDNIGFEFIEYRLNNNDTWQKIPEFESWSLANGNQHWHMYFDSTTLEDGEYVFRFRAFDGKHYSEDMTIRINVDNSGQDGSTIEIPRSFTLFLLCTALILLFGALIFVVRAPDDLFERANPPPDADRVPDARVISRGPPPDPPGRPPASRSSSVYASFSPFDGSASLPTREPESSDGVEDAVSISICRLCGTPTPPTEPGKLLSADHCAVCGKDISG